MHKVVPPGRAKGVDLEELVRTAKDRRPGGVLLRSASDSWAASSSDGVVSEND
eukprot:COSAG06_NODE_81_length_25302_cov_21.168902_7_plen_53_part_00